MTTEPLLKLPTRDTDGKESGEPYSLTLSAQSHGMFLVYTEDESEATAILLSLEDINQLAEAANKAVTP